MPKAYLGHNFYLRQKLLQKKLFSHPKINVIWDSVVSEIVGTENPKGVTAVKLKNIKTNTITEIQMKPPNFLASNIIQGERVKRTEGNDG